MLEGQYVNLGKVLFPCSIKLHKGKNDDFMPNFNDRDLVLKLLDSNKA